MLEVGVSLFVLLALMLLIDVLQERRAVRMDKRLQVLGRQVSNLADDVEYLLKISRIIEMKVDLNSDVIIAGQNDENQRSKFAIPHEPVILPL